MQTELHDSLMRLDEATWRSSESFTNWFESLLCLNPISPSSAAEVYFLNLHYVSPLESKLHDIRNRIRAYIHMHEEIQKIKGAYENAIRLYDIEKSHLCARMITEDWIEVQKFRYYFCDYEIPKEAQYIVIPPSVFTSLIQVPIRTDPRRFDDAYRQISTKPIQNDIKLLRDAICSKCRLKDQSVCWKDNSVFLRELFGTFNLTLRAIQKQIFRNNFIEITFSPISISWNGNHDVVAVLVSITGHDSDKTTEIPLLDTLLSEYSCIVDAVHHRELLFEFLTRKKESTVQSLCNEFGKEVERRKYKIQALLANNPDPEVRPKTVLKVEDEIRKIQSLQNACSEEISGSKNMTQVETVEDRYLHHLEEIKTHA
jgi:hypothetical protein